jgi:hypothetical protein
VGLDGDDVREQVAALEGEVLDDEIERVVGVLDARDGDISDLLNESRHNDAADVVPEFGLELERTLRVEEKVLSESSPVVAEALVELS